MEGKRVLRIVHASIDHSQVSSIAHFDQHPEKQFERSKSNDCIALRKLSSDSKPKLRHTFDYVDLVQSVCESNLSRLVEANSKRNGNDDPGRVA